MSAGKAAVVLLRLGQHVRVGQHVRSGQLVWRSLVRNADLSAVCSRNFESQAAGMENETCRKHVFTNCARRLRLGEFLL